MYVNGVNENTFIIIRLLMLITDSFVNNARLTIAVNIIRVIIRRIVNPL